MSLLQSVILSLLAARCTSFMIHHAQVRRVGVVTGSEYAATRLFLLSKRTNPFQGIEFSSIIILYFLFNMRFL